MNLSHQAIEDLRTALRKSYGGAFDAELCDEEINEIGELLLNVLAEGLRQRAHVQ